MAAISSQETGEPKSASRSTKRRARRVPHLSRELSWIDFNARVLHEAADERNPPMERIKFLAIFASNLDEFFQVRISTLRRARASRVTSLVDGPSASEQLVQARRQILDLARDQSAIYKKLRKLLAQHGVEIVDYAKVPEHHAALRERFLT